MPQEKEPTILTSSSSGIQTIKFNDPLTKNAVSKTMYEEVIKILNNSAQNDNIQMVVVTGAGDCFSSGNNFVSATSEDLEEALNTFKNFVDTIITYPKLLVAIVNGPAVGIAVTMLGLFDVVYASDKAGEMLYFGYKMSATEARDCGLVSKIYKHDMVDQIWNYLEKMVAELSRESILATKILTKQWNRDILLQTNAKEVEGLKKRMTSEDFINQLRKLFNRKSKI